MSPTCWLREEINREVFEILTGCTHSLQMKEWFSKVENARAVARRPAPSYTRFRDSRDEYQEDTEEVPSLKEMQKFDTSRLQLPDVPDSDMATVKAKPLRTAGWAQRAR